MTLAWDSSTGIAGYRLYVGGASRTYTNVIAAGKGTSATVSNLASGATYFFAITAYDTKGLESDFSSEVSYTVPLPTKSPPGTTLTLAADSGTFTAPLVAANGTLRQPLTTGLNSAGRAVYCFNLVNGGKYLVSALICAPNQAENSLYVNIDAEPTDPLMIWDIPVCTSFTSRTVSWRGNGNGDPASSQYNPKVFDLSAGTHQLIIRGREGNTTLGAITIAATPPKLALRTVAGAAASPSGALSPPKASVILSATGQPGQTYDILCSQNLQVWSLMGAMTLDASGAAEFTDPAGASQPRRMYRLQSVTPKPPTLQIQITAGGSVLLSGAGQSGQTYNVLCSPDCRTWTAIGTVTPDTKGSFAFTDPADNSRPKRFYRLQGQ